MKRKQQNLVFKNLNWQKIRQQELSDDIISIDKIRRQCKWRKKIVSHSKDGWREESRWNGKK